jgi:hypothetical protein
VGSSGAVAQASHQGVLLAALARGHREDFPLDPERRARGMRGRAGPDSPPGLSPSGRAPAAERPPAATLRGACLRAGRAAKAWLGGAGAAPCGRPQAPRPAGARSAQRFASRGGASLPPGSGRLTRSLIALDTAALQPLPRLASVVTYWIVSGGLSMLVELTRLLIAFQLRAL